MRFNCCVSLQVVPNFRVLDALAKKHPEAFSSSQNRGVSESWIHSEAIVSSNNRSDPTPPPHPYFTLVASVHESVHINFQLPWSVDLSQYHMVKC